MPMQISISNAIKGESSSGGGSSFENLYSFEFDGNTDYIESSSPYTVLAGDSQATFSFWFKLQKDSNAQYPLSCYDIANARFIFGIRFQRTSPTDVRVWFYLNTATNNNRTFANLGSLNADGQWHHLMIGMDLTRPNYQETNFYLDGVPFTQNGYTASSIITSFTGFLSIGNRANTFSEYYGGHIDEVAIWSGQDLSSDVATIYNGGVPNDLNDNGLTAPTTWYRMGDAATHNGREWELTDQGSAGINVLSQTLPAPPTAPSTDVPT